jgi:hypothetical protein
MNGAQPRAADNDPAQLRLTGQQLFDPGIARQEQLVNRQYRLWRAVAARLEQLQVVDKDALALLKPSFAHIDLKVLVVIGDKALDVTTDLIIQPQVDVSAESQRRHGGDNQAPVK